MERDALAARRVLDLLGVPWREEPVVLGEELLPDASDRQPTGDGLIDDVLGQRLPPGPSIIAVATSFEAISA